VIRIRAPADSATQASVILSRLMIGVTLTGLRYTWSVAASTKESILLARLDLLKLLR